MRAHRRCGLANSDVPGLGAAIRTVAPPITSPFQRILQVERRLLRPDPDRLPACRIKQDGERRRSGRRQREVQNLQQRVTVVDGAVCLVEVAGPVQQVAEFRPIEAVLPPIDLRRGACPTSSSIFLNGSAPRLLPGALGSVAPRPSSSLATSTSLSREPCDLLRREALDDSEEPSV